MKSPLPYLLLTALLLPACAQNTRRSPALSNSADTTTPPKKNFLTRTGDATWNVVSAPARWVAPKPAAPAEQETFEPADAYISVPTDTPPDTQPH